MRFILIYKFIYVFLIALNIAVAAYRQYFISQGSGYFSGKLSFWLIWLIVNCYLLLKIYEKRLFYKLLVLEEAISLCRIAMIIFVAGSLGLYLMPISPVYESIWHPLIIGMKLLNKNSNLLFFYFPLIILGSFEISYFRLITKNQDFLKSRFKINEAAY